MTYERAVITLWFGASQSTRLLALQQGLLDLIPLKLCTHETHSKQTHNRSLLLI